MPRIRLCALLCAASLSVATPAFAWMTAPARNPDNGHYYAFFNGADDDRLSPPAMTFADALTRAASKSHLGIRGHLATITSQVEQDFVVQYFRDFGPRPYPLDKSWIAGSDAAVEGEWRWVAGPEEGQLFWQGKADGQALDYQNWLTRTNGSTREPNNSPSYFNRDGEDYLALIFQESERLPSYWNDVVGLEDNSRSSPRLGIVEFSLPEPTSGALIASAGLMLIAACRRRPNCEGQIKGVRTH
jgi:hypothetical protein